MWSIHCRGVAIHCQCVATVASVWSIHSQSMAIHCRGVASVVDIENNRMAETRSGWQSMANQ